MASLAMGALRPIFQVQASVQAGKYDKWEVRKEIEEEIKSVRGSQGSKERPYGRFDLYTVFVRTQYDLTIYMC